MNSVVGGKIKKEILSHPIRVGFIFDKKQIGFIFWKMNNRHIKLRKLRV